MAKARGGQVRKAGNKTTSGKARVAKAVKKNAKKSGKSGEGEILGAPGPSKSPVPKVKKTKKRVERILAKKEPQLIEGPKNALVVRGLKTSQTVKDTLSDLALILKPFNKTFSRKNEILPFEDMNSLEFLCEKNDCSTFALGTHSKKRPDNLVLGRMYEGHLLDMYEFGISDLHRVQEFSGMKKKVGSKPLIVFAGETWENDSKFVKIQNLLLDFFRGPRNDKVALAAIDHMISFSIDDNGKIMMRSYATEFLHSGSKEPTLSLEPMGPNMDLTLRRSQLPSEDLWKTACRQPDVAQEKKVKNIARNSLGDKVGTIHMKRQNLDRLSSRTRRVTALRDGKRELVDVDENFGRATRSKNDDDE
jgi:ribosome production factor 2